MTPAETKAFNLISKIEVSFAAPVLLPDDFEQKLMAMLSAVCKSYEAEHPDRVMWVFGMGGKLLWREPQEPDCDMSILSIEVAEREKYNEGDPS